jgi:hypothetical protein
MTTGTNHPNGTGRWIGHAALALGVLLATGGCKTPGAIKRSPEGRYTFNITFDDNGCPLSAQATFQNCSPLPGEIAPPKDCIRVLKGDTVEFVAITKGGAPSPAGFLLQFDPFKKGTFKPPQQLLKVDTYGIAGKPFTFNVLAEPPLTCTPLDPQIIVD